MKEVRRFHGMASYYRRFVPNFAHVAGPITDLTAQGKKKIEWTQAHQDAFDKLKEYLITAPILATPQWHLMFTIHTDASDYAVGAVLTQGDEDDERPIAYMSKKLVGAQKRYTTTEKECLAILTAIKHFRCYIEGVKFKVITDHAALRWLFSIKVQTGRLARWIAELSCYNFEIEHKSGVLHEFPDALSRIQDAPEPELVYNVQMTEPEVVGTVQVEDKTESGQ
jgi:hypothetical protein